MASVLPRPQCVNPSQLPWWLSLLAQSPWFVWTIRSVGGEMRPVSRKSQCFPGRLNTSRLRQNGCHFSDDIFKFIFLCENCHILCICLFPKSSINNKPALAQIMAGRWTGYRHYLNQWWPAFIMHICATWSWWVKTGWHQTDTTFL